MTDEKYDILKRYFGYDTFREGQEQVIDELLSGRDVLGVMPTGAGKSLCYQIPALIFPGITLVISPLISLMKDQVRALNEAGVHAAYLNSSLTQGQYYKALSLAVEGRYPIIYVAPERLLTDSFLSFAVNADIAFHSGDRISGQVISRSQNLLRNFRSARSWQHLRRLQRKKSGMISRISLC